MASVRESRLGDVVSFLLQFLGRFLLGPGEGARAPNHQIRRRRPCGRLQSRDGRHHGR